MSGTLWDAASPPSEHEHIKSYMITTDVMSAAIERINRALDFKLCSLLYTGGNYFVFALKKLIAEKRILELLNSNAVHGRPKTFL